MTRPSNLHGSVPAKAKAGFAHFELLRILSLFFLFVLVVRFGGWIVGTEVSWVASMAIGVVAPTGLLVVIGIAASVRRSGKNNGRAADGSTPDGNLETTAPLPSAAQGEADRCVALLHDEEAKRRLRIFVRDAGTFYCQEEYFSEHSLEQCWIPIGTRTVGIYDSEETALREARACIDWLIGV